METRRIWVLVLTGPMLSIGIDLSFPTQPLNFSSRECTHVGSHFSRYHVLQRSESEYLCPRPVGIWFLVPTTSNELFMLQTSDVQELYLYDNAPSYRSQWP
jgi:hypothetical protein